MAIITVSRGSYCRGKEIAEKVAKELGYECISREVLLEASEEFNIPEVKLVRALHDAPSVLERFTHGQEKYVAFIRQAFLERVRGDNVVYHGLAGHFFLKEVAHVLKIRVVCDIDTRVKLEAEREKIPEDEARRLLKKDDHERRKWSEALYGIDTSDPSLYDLVIHTRPGGMCTKESVDLICRTVRLPQFETTPESQKALDDLLAEAKARSSS